MQYCQIWLVLIGGLRLSHQRRHFLDGTPNSSVRIVGSI